MTKYKCPKCNKIFNRLVHMEDHINRITSCNKLKATIISTLSKTIFNCKYCNKNYSRNDSLLRHLNNNLCKVKKQITNVTDTDVNLIKTKIDYPVSNQLINIIIDKSKKIQELESKYENNEPILEFNINSSNTFSINKNNQLNTLILNNVIIEVRNEDNYINAIQLCQAGDKNFYEWYSLESTKQLANELELLETSIIDSMDPTNYNYEFSKFIQINNENNSSNKIWIHLDLANHLAQWISTKISLQFSKWIRTLSINENTYITNKIFKEKDNEIKLKDQKIQLLENTFIKKQLRRNYPEYNVIYIVTTEYI